MLILIADDHADARQVLRVLLEIEKHTVLEAANGLEAVEIATSTHPDLILMDLSMPVMDGMAAIRTLRADSSTSDIRIIVISGNENQAEWKHLAADCGCDKCFAKPVDFDSLRRAIDQPRI